MAMTRAGTADASIAARQPQGIITAVMNGGAMAEPRPTDPMTSPLARPIAAGAVQRATPSSAAGYVGDARPPIRSRSATSPDRAAEADQPLEVPGTAAC